VRDLRSDLAHAHAQIGADESSHLIFLRWLVAAAEDELDRQVDGALSSSDCGVRGLQRAAANFHDLERSLVVRGGTWRSCTAAHGESEGGSELCFVVRLVRHRCASVRSSS